MRQAGQVCSSGLNFANFDDLGSQRGGNLDGVSEGVQAGGTLLSVLWERLRTELRGTRRARSITKLLGRRACHEREENGEMPWSDKEIQAMAEAHFCGREPSCAGCGTTVIVNEMATLGSKTVPLVMHCSRCGEEGAFSEPHLEALDLEWTNGQMHAIVDEYWKHGFAHCPNDGAILHVEKIDLLGASKAMLAIHCKRCGRQMGSGQLEQAKRRSPFEEKYDIIREINAGGMGQVSLVRERATGRQFAAKTIRPEFLREAQMIRRFQREKRLLAALDHPNVVKFLDTFMDETGGVLVMEYMPRGDLGRAINDRSVTATTLADLFDGLAAGVEYMHSRGIAHRDLKPGNVLIDDAGVARVSDFGLAVLQMRDTTPLTAVNAGLGTLHYAAPEQLTEAATATAKADVYALALIAYEIAKRESPWSPPIVGLGNALFDSTLSSALARDPDRRTATVRGLAVAVRQLLLPGAGPAT